jgi:hypothetical protein
LPNRLWRGPLALKGQRESTPSLPSLSLTAQWSGWSPAAAFSQAQQKALDYPALPFVMLEHPVAIATDAEVEHKVELIYAELVEKLTGSVPTVSGKG